MSEEVAARSLGRSTAVMAAGTAVSRVLGFVRSALLVAAVGITSARAADAFTVANTLPNIFYMLIAGGVINAVLVPQVVRAYRSANGQEYVDRLLTVSFVILGGATVVLWAASPLIVRIFLSGEQAVLATGFALWCVPQVFFYGVYTLLGQVLNARGSFGPYMWAPVVNNVIAIAGLVAFIAVYGTWERPAPGTVEDLSVWSGGRVTLLAATATLGVVAQAAILVWPLRRLGFRYRPRRGWRGAGLGSAGRVAGWTFAALAVGQLGAFVVMKIAALASDAGSAEPGIPGNIAYNQAFTIFMLPHSLVTVSLITALFTRLSDHAAARDVRAVRVDFSHGLRTIGVFTLFAAPAISVIAVPLLRAMYPSTAQSDAAAMAPIIVAFMCGLAAVGAWSLVQRVFYAYEDAKGLFRIQVAMAVVVVVVSVLGWLVAEPRHWVAWAAAGMSLSYLVGAVWGGAQVWRRLGGGLSRIIRLHVRAGLAAAIATGLGWLLSRVFGNLAASSWFIAVFACALVGVVMVVAYGLALRWLGVTELDDFLRPLLVRLAPLMRRLEPVTSRLGPLGALLAPPAEPASRSMGTPGPAAVPSATVQRVPVPTGGGFGYGRFGRPERGGDRLDAVIGRGTLLAGRYRLHQPVATDLPDAQTWTARDQILDRPVRAIVLVGADPGPAQDAARRAALVSDPRLLRVLDVGDHEGVAYVVTEPVVGQDLGRLTANGPLPADQARAVVGEAAAALEVARRRGVHHLALRPESVHVTPDGAVLVTGLAVDGELFGNARGDAKTTSRADTVGLVALLYLALTGRWPAASATPGAPGTPEAQGSGVGPSTPVAPSVSGAPVPPAELSPAVPADLDTLCAVTLGPHDDGPHSPGELVRELEPWPAIDAATIYDSLDAATRTAIAPSGPWDEGGPGAGAGAGGAAAAGGAGGAAAGGIAGAPVAAQVQRQSVRQSVLPPGQPGQPAQPGQGTPAVRRPTGVPPIGGGRPISSAVRGPGAPAGPGPMPPHAAQPHAMAPPVVPPPARPAPPHRDGAFDAILEEPVPLVRRRFNATPIVLGLIGLLVVVGLFWAWNALTAPAPPIGGQEGLSLDEETPGTGTDEPASPDASPSPTTPPADDGAPSGTAPVIASAQMLDPPPGGDNNEHPEAVPLAIDGDPTTFWFTRTYASPTYGMKEGVGYAVTLEAPATVTTVRLQVNGTGGRVEVRATDPATPTEGEVLAHGELSPDTVLTLDQPTEAQTIVLWFPALPQTPDGRNRIELLELQLS